MNCKICSHQVNFFAQAKILNKYEVEYFQCEWCGFINTTEPYWLEEAYSEAISDLDLGVVERARVFSRLTKSLILTSFNCNAKFLDYGGGYGLFVRIMRDSGFDFYRYDKYCINTLAKGFDAEKDDKEHYELITAFEVFEHLVNPLQELEQILKFSRNIFFSTLLVPATNPRPGDWWYYAPEQGQHISFYTRKSLEILTKTFGLNLYTDGNMLHLITEKELPPYLFKLASRNRTAVLLYFMLRGRLKKRSLLADDTARITGWFSEENNIK